MVAKLAPAIHRILAFGDLAAKRNVLLVNATWISRVKTAGASGDVEALVNLLRHVVLKLYQAHLLKKDTFLIHEWTRESLSAAGMGDLTDLVGYAADNLLSLDESAAACEADTKPDDEPVDVCEIDDDSDSDGAPPADDGGGGASGGGPAESSAHAPAAEEEEPAEDEPQSGALQLYAPPPAEEADTPEEAGAPEASEGGGGGGAEEPEASVIVVADSSSDASSEQDEVVPAARARAGGAKRGSPEADSAEADAAAAQLAAPAADATAVIAAAPPAAAAGAAAGAGAQKRARRDPALPFEAALPPAPWGALFSGLLRHLRGDPSAPPIDALVAAATSSSPPLRLHRSPEWQGLCLAHAASSVDAAAPLLDAILRSAAAESAAALKTLLACPAKAGSEGSPFSRTVEPAAQAARAGRGVVGFPTLTKGATPLMFACLHGALSPAALLLRCGASATHREPCVFIEVGFVCAVDVAAISLAPSAPAVLAHVLAQRGVRAGAADKNTGYTASMWAAFYGRFRAVRLLCAAGANPSTAVAVNPRNTDPQQRMTAAHWAMTSVSLKDATGRKEAEDDVPLLSRDDPRLATLVELIAAGYAPGSVRNRFTPCRADAPLLDFAYEGCTLHAAVAAWRPGGDGAASEALLPRLLAAGRHLSPPLDLNVGAGTELGSPLHLAVRNGAVELALMLIRAGADVNASDARGLTCAAAAARSPPSRRGCDMLRLLADANLLSAPASCGRRTPAHEAVLAGRPDCLLLLRCLRPECLASLDAHGLTPLALAQASYPPHGALLDALRHVATATPAPRTVEAGPWDDDGCEDRDAAEGEGADAGRCRERACAASTRVAVDDDVALPTSFVFVSRSMPLPCLASAPVAAPSPGVAACCRCAAKGLCVPGACDSLRVTPSSAARLVNTAQELDFNTTTLAKLLKELRSWPPSSPLPAALDVLCANDVGFVTRGSPLMLFSTGLALSKSPPPVSPSLCAVGLAASLLYLPQLENLLVPPCAVTAAHRSWRQRVESAAADPDVVSATARLSHLLLELADELTSGMRAAALSCASRDESAWQAAQRTALLSTFLPVWRASVRAAPILMLCGAAGGGGGDAGAPSSSATADDPVRSALAACADACTSLVVALRSVHSPLRVVAVDQAGGARLADVLKRHSPVVDVCGHVGLGGAPCAGGGCCSALRCPQFPVRLRNTRATGVGAFNGRVPIKTGSLVMPFPGETLSAAGYEARAAQFHGARDFYGLSLQHPPWRHLAVRSACPAPGKDPYEHAVLDPTLAGGAARFVNHRCRGASLGAIAVRWPGCDVPLLYFVALKDIEPYEEFTWSYNADKLGDAKLFDHPCACDDCEEVRNATGRRGKAAGR